MIKLKTIKTRDFLASVMKRILGFPAWMFLGFKSIVFKIFGFAVWLLKDIYKKKWRILFAIMLSGGAYYLWGLSSGLLWLLFFVFLFCAWENRVIAAMALVSLSSCPVLLQFKQDKVAEEMAVYAYFFLVMTVVLQMIEYRREGRAEKKKEKSVKSQEDGKVLLLSDKIKMIIGDPHGFVLDVEHSLKKTRKELKEGDYVFVDKNNNGKIDENEIIETKKVQLSLLSDEKCESPKEVTKKDFDIFREYALRDKEVAVVSEKIGIVVAGRKGRGRKKEVEVKRK